MCRSRAGAIVASCKCTVQARGAKTVGCRAVQLRPAARPTTQGRGRGRREIRSDIWDAGVRERGDAAVGRCRARDVVSHVSCQELLMQEPRPTT